MLRGVVERDDDVSGVTGTGSVAEFVISGDGRVVIFWPVGEGSFPSLQEAMKVHGHSGKTKFIILDDEKLQTKHCNECHEDPRHPQCPSHDFGCPGCINGVS